ncbi:MAG: hypothetical protein ACM35G_10810 [Planctomycetaceae bacterium]
MRRTDRRSVRRAATVLAGLLVLGSTGAARAGLGWPFRGTPEEVVASQQGYVVNRTVLSRLAMPKPVYLSNYAGVYYPSRVPGSPLTPTTFRAMMGRPRLFGGSR